MRLGVLFSGGKDSCYSAYLAKKQEHELTCLISIISENPESYMFHTPNISLTTKQAQVMNIPLLTHKTKGIKEDELKDLEEAIKQAIEKYDVQGLVTGALHSEYQKSRIKEICNKLGIECINPLWHIDAEKYWKDLFDNNFEVMIVGVASDGLCKKWLGKIIDKKAFEELKKLQKKFKFHLAFEGGEAETFITDCPLFKKRLKVINGRKTWDGNSGKYFIEEIESITKQANKILFLKS